MFVMKSVCNFAQSPTRIISNRRHTSAAKYVYLLECSSSEGDTQCLQRGAREAWPWSFHTPELFMKMTRQTEVGDEIKLAPNSLFLSKDLPSEKREKRVSIEPIDACILRETSFFVHKVPSRRKEGTRTLLTFKFKLLIVSGIWNLNSFGGRFFLLPVGLCLNLAGCSWHLVRFCCWLCSKESCSNGGGRLMMMLDAGALFPHARLARGQRTVLSSLWHLLRSSRSVLFGYDFV